VRNMNIKTWIATGAVALFVAGAAVTGAVAHNVHSAPATNAAACAMYADSYNRMADAFRNLLEKNPSQKSVDVLEIESELPAQLAAAYKRATGRVAAVMSPAVGQSKTFFANTSNTAAGRDFFATSASVGAVCKASRSPITLHALQSTI